MKIKDEKDRPKLREHSFYGGSIFNSHDRDLDDLRNPDFIDLDDSSF